MLLLGVAQVRDPTLLLDRRHSAACCRRLRTFRELACGDDNADHVAVVALPSECAAEKCV